MSISVDSNGLNPKVKGLGIFYCDGVVLVKKERYDDFSLCYDREVNVIRYNYYDLDGNHTQNTNVDFSLARPLKEDELKRIFTKGNLIEPIIKQLQNISVYEEHFEVNEYKTIVYAGKLFVVKGGVSEEVLSDEYYSYMEFRTYSHKTLSASVDTIAKDMGYAAFFDGMINDKDFIKKIDPVKKEDIPYCVIDKRKRLVLKEVQDYKDRIEKSIEKVFELHETLNDELRKYDEEEFDELTADNIVNFLEMIHMYHHFIEFKTDDVRSLFDTITAPRAKYLVTNFLN